MREKVDILPLKGRSDDLPDPNREKPEKSSEKQAGRKKPIIRKREKNAKKK
jgi:hypothetical protein